MAKSRIYRGRYLQRNKIRCARTREEIVHAKPNIEEWLRVRGLALHLEKTKIVHINTGFNFLAFSIKRYGGKCLIKPQKEKVLAFLQRIRQWLSTHRQAPAEEVIKHLNPILRGWSNYYKHMVSKQTFSYVNHQVWQALWKWCLRRHPKKGKHWVFMKYFHSDKHQGWKFHGDFENTKGDSKRIYLFDVSSVAIKRHVMIRSAASPDDPSLREYWRERRQRRTLYPQEQLALEA